MRRYLPSCLAAALLLMSTISMCDDTDDWQTLHHEPGYCAMYDICGHRNDTDVLNCPANIQAQPLTDSVAMKLRTVCPSLAEDIGSDGHVCCSEAQLDQLQQQIQLASAILVGCPACNHNFKQFFCLLTCSPNQATFSNITALQQTADTNVTAVAQVDTFVASKFGTAFYDSCKDVVFSATNMKAMLYVGGGAKNFQEWFDFLGLVKDKRFPPQGSPFQINFPPEDQLPEGMQALTDKIPGCGDAPFACSCGDCPAADGCAPPSPSPPPPESTCSWLPFPGANCYDLTSITLYIVILACLPRLIKYLKYQQQLESGEETSPQSRRQTVPSITTFSAAAAGDGVREPLLESGIGDDITEADDDGGEITAADIKELDLVDYPVAEHMLRHFYYSLGLVCCRKPWRTLAVCAAIVAVFTLGLVRLQVIREPIKLWVAPGSQALAEKERYETAFGPFYRITQLIISLPPSAADNDTNNSIITDNAIQLMFDVQQQVDTLQAPLNTTFSNEYSNSNDADIITLEDVCFKPIGDVCATQSFLQYWAMNRDMYTSAVLSPQYCLAHWSTACRAQNGAPNDPHIVLGGFTDDPINATAFVVTYLLVGKNTDEIQAAQVWEAAFLDLADNTLTAMVEQAGFKLSYSSERSVQDELSRESRADAGTVAGSYLAMMLYIAIALGSFKRGSSLKDVLVQGRASVAFGGVLIVASAVLAALGVCGWLGIGATLIIAEVIPFVALAIGTDNMFLLAAACEDAPATASPAERAAFGLAAAGPSITLAALCEVATFALGVLSPMPALKNFAACASLALGIDFLLQLTAFPALLALDGIRRDEARYDCAPWIKANSVWVEEDDEDVDRTNNTGQSQANRDLVDAVLDEEEQAVVAEYGHSFGNRHKEEEQDRWGVGPALRWYMKRHAKWLTTPVVQAGVLAVFAGLALFNLAASTRLELGLDQAVALPTDSYLQSYFSDIKSQLRVGPPVMFVVSNLNLSSDVDSACSTAACSPNSLLNQIAAASRQPWNSYLASPAASWIDDFISWTDPQVPQCCRFFPGDDKKPCPPPDQPPCDADQAVCEHCTTCLAPGAPAIPTVETFEALLPQFLNATPSDQCAKGGAGAYTDAFQMTSPDPSSSSKEEPDPSAASVVAGLSEGVVVASAFRANYVTLSEQSDFINALKASRDIASTASDALGLDIFAYSVFHPFFEQYLNLSGIALAILGSSAVAIFAICLIGTGSIPAAGIILVTLCSLIVDLLGWMAVTGAQLNAVSVVNLAAACGLGVEFCAHIMHAYLESSGKTSRERARDAVSDVGASVLSGITLTKLVGVGVLATAKTGIFREYYFKFYLGLVVSGAAHGLIFLPTLLSLLGPEAYKHIAWKRQ